MAIKLDIVGNPVRRLSLAGVPLKQRGKADKKRCARNDKKNNIPPGAAEI